jgi:CheY-like chemotaxis protein
VEEAAAFLAEPAGRKGIELTCQSGPAAPQTHGDGLRIRQVLLNILGNAVKFTERGEVNLTMTWEPQGDRGLLARFEIRDSGIGMSAHTVERLFEPFSQADGSHTRRYGGTGLGLAISKKLVDLMGGTIGAHSELGRGSTFWFTIPLGISLNPAARQPPLRTSLDGCRALVIDDSATNRDILAAQMGYWSMDVTAVEGAAEGLAFLRTALAGNRPYGVVLLDYKMPGINGLDLTRIVRADPALHATPILLLTSYSGSRTYEESRQAGVDMQMTKPVQSRQLREALDRLLTAPRHRAVSNSHPERATEDVAPVRRSEHLLLVEDNPANRRVALTVLDRLGYVCDVADNGEEALHAMASKNYALVLMDLQMPQLDGLETTAAIRALEGNRRSTRIIAMTANAMVGDRERCLEAGMDDYLVKPFRPKQLEDILHRWLEPMREGT